MSIIIARSHIFHARKSMIEICSVLGLESNLKIHKNL